MSQHFADRLAAGCRAKGNALCVGIDPRWEALPLEIRERHHGGALIDAAAAFTEFGLRLLDIVAPLVPVVKLQSAFFEACGPTGFMAQQEILKVARQYGLITILDNKRNDIATTAAAYADAAFLGTMLDGKRLPVWQADAITINPYLGRDAVEPFLESARQAQAGVFVLVRTSNKGAGLFQDLECRGRPLYQHVAEEVGKWAAENRGACGYGDVGAVVGATHPAELATLRNLIPQTIFLIPGYGAQGGIAADTAAGFDANGLGAIVNSSRGIIACFKPEHAQWEQAIEAATKSAVAELRAATAMKTLTHV